MPSGAHTTPDTKTPFHGEPTAENAENAENTVDYRTTDMSHPLPREVRFFSYENKAGDM
ncbi:hypothetical protein [Streptomyces beihaiensis]|uniref:Uncharacterized protein n=1 Tax=Streptomyces beihaiensis TaxID=2984495 RepID=A0ABT3TMX3_9ACTN|nr:hypothetical protein [Streptomyces beihaiensis]MCX3058394.1 hypothetical protein [Streptomyces beihaiensis]